MAKTPKRRALGTALRQAREKHGITLRDFAHRIEREPSLLSRWENGERTPRPEQVAQILATLGVTGTRYDEVVALAYDTDAPHWLATSLPEHRSILTAFVDYEQSSTTITDVSPLLIPGLLQSEDYIGAIMHSGGIPGDEINTRIAIRIGRREVITRWARPARFFGLIGEGALYQVVGDAATMVNQLAHLLEMGKRPNVELRIVPYDNGWNPATEGAFTLFEPEQETSVIHLETRRSGLFLHADEDLRAYERAITAISAKAATPEESRQLIARAAHLHKRKTTTTIQGANTP